MLCLAVSVVSIVGCSKLENEQEKPVVSNEEKETVEQETEQEVNTQENNTVLGEGQTKFMFSVFDKDGNERKFEIHTDKKTVGEALLDVDMIAGDKGEYGLYVKTVNGITADYDVDKTYWAFYVDGEYATSGVDTTNIEEGKTYSFKIEK
jgi:hypothetical protein